MSCAPLPASGVHLLAPCVDATASAVTVLHTTSRWLETTWSKPCTAVKWMSAFLLSMMMDNGDPMQRQAYSAHEGMPWGQDRLMVTSVLLRGNGASRP